VRDERGAAVGPFRLVCTDGGIGGSPDGLRRSYALLAVIVAWSLPNTRKVYLNDYAANVFEGGGCGLLGIAGVGIDAHEGAVMTRWGERMNAAIATAARTFAGDPERWNLVGGLQQRFNGHAYCPAHSWFVSYEHSWRYQGNNNGTAHPNPAGHAAYASLIRQAMGWQITRGPSGSVSPVGRPRHRTGGRPDRRSVGLGAAAVHAVVVTPHRDWVGQSGQGRDRRTLGPGGGHGHQRCHVRWTSTGASGCVG
jgi:hypothetical protein